MKDPKLLLKVLVERQNLWEALKLIVSSFSPSSLSSLYLVCFHPAQRECDDESIDEMFLDFLDLCHERMYIQCALLSGRQ